jgi:hypothetical protein
MNAQKGSIEKGPFVYSVFYNSDEAEVVRTGFGTRAQLGGVQSEMVSAVEQVTTCKPVVGTIEGDISLMRMKLVC